MTGSAVLVLAAVFVVGADVVPPGLDAAGEALDHPHASLGCRLAGQAEGGRARLVHRHALGGSLSQPSRPCTSLPVSAFSWKPVASPRD